MSQPSTESGSHGGMLDALRNNTFQRLAGAGMAVMSLAGCVEGCSSSTPSPSPGEQIGAIQEIDIPIDGLSGATKVADGTRLQDVGLKIHNYNDDAEGANGQYQRNVPMIFIKHAKVGNEFTIKAGLTVDAGATATLVIDAKNPQVYDDFRVDQGTHIDISSTALSYSLYDGRHDNKFATNGQRVSLTDGKSQKDIQFSKTQDSQLSVTVNGQVIPLPGANPFTTGEVWLGAQTSQGETTLNKLAVAGSGVKLEDTTDFKLGASADGLAKLAHQKGSGPDVGTAVSAYDLFGNEQYRSTVINNATIITTENAAKFQNVEPKEGVWTFEQLDALVDAAQRNNLKVHGHTLVYHHGLPDWVSNLPTGTADEKARVQEVMRTYITTVVGRYKGRITSWDVGNELLAFNQPGQTWRSSLWLKAYNSDIDAFLTDALTTAHNADPAAELFINDFALDKKGTYDPRSDSGTGDEGRFHILMNELVKLKGQGVPVDGIGSEGHVYERPRDDSDFEECVQTSGTIASGLGCRMTQAESLGLKFRISEMDVTQDIKQGSSFNEDRAGQTKLFAAAAQACLKHSNCVAFETWGPGGPGTSTPSVDSNTGLVTPHSHVLFNESFQPVPAYDEVRKAFSG